MRPLSPSASDGAERVVAPLLPLRRSWQWSQIAEHRSMEPAALVRVRASRILLGCRIHRPTVVVASSQIAIVAVVADAAVAFKLLLLLSRFSSVCKFR